MVIVQGGVELEAHQALVNMGHILQVRFKVRNILSSYIMNISFVWNNPREKFYISKVLTKIIYDLLNHIDKNTNYIP